MKRRGEGRERKVEGRKGREGVTSVYAPLVSHRHIFPRWRKEEGRGNEEEGERRGEERRGREGRGELECFSMHHVGTILVVLVVGDPHFAEGVEGGKDRPSDPCRILSLWGCRNLNLDIFRR